jgi:hypothetical protein
MRPALLAALTFALGVLGGSHLQALLEPTPAAAAAAQHTSAPAAGAWAAQVRLPGTPGGACPADPLVILVLGQSNATNSVGHRFAADGDVHAFFRGACHPARGALPGGSSPFGSYWPAVGDELARNGAKGGVVFAIAAMGGSKAGDWASPQKLGWLLEERLAELRAASLEPDLVVWMQGESDVDTPAGAYRADVSAVFGRVWAAYPRTLIMVAQTTYCFGRDSAPIRDAQRTLATSGDPRIKLGPDSDALRAEADRYDDCHFSERGGRKMAALWAGAISTAMAGQAR